jgi:hypothetical protein
MTKLYCDNCLVEIIGKKTEFKIEDTVVIQPNNKLVGLLISVRFPAHKGDEAICFDCAKKAILTALGIAA